jgi:hypothetical protein
MMEMHDASEEASLLLLLLLLPACQLRVSF